MRTGARGRSPGSGPTDKADAGGGDAPFELPGGYREYYALEPRDSGAALPAPVQRKMERSFESSFSDVRVHEGGQAPSIGAVAYTQGSHVCFAPGAYDPGSERGQRLIGHELAHVVQQRSGSVEATQKKGELAVNSDSALERAADEAGDRAARGEPARLSSGAPTTPGVQRRVIQLQREDRPFGSYWVSNEPPKEDLGPTVEPMDVAQFKELDGLWNELASGGAKGLRISDEDSNKQKHGGFSKLVVDALAKLLSRKHGRMLVRELCKGGQTVTIRPLPAGNRENKTVPLGHDEGKGSRGATDQPGVKDDAVVELDPTMGDDTVFSFDSEYKPLATPVFLVLGHELIHARHMTLGVSANTETKPKNPLHHETCEEETIETGNPLDKGGVTENMLRGEHKLGERFGHDAVDVRDLHFVQLTGDFTLAEVAAFGGETLPDLFADNAKLADDLLINDPTLAGAFVANTTTWKEEATKQDQDGLAAALEDDSVELMAALSVLKHDPKLAIQTLLADNSKIAFGELACQHGYLVDLVGKQQIDVESLMSMTAEEALTKHPSLVAAMLEESDGKKLLRESEDARNLLAADPRVRINLSLMHKDMTTQKMAEKAQTPLMQVLLANPALGQATCTAKQLVLRKCVVHRVRQKNQVAQTLDEVVAEYTARGGRAAVERLNCGLKEPFKLGQKLNIPVA